MTYVNRSIHQRLWHSPLFETLSAAELSFLAVLAFPLRERGQILGKVTSGCP